ncbi:MAG: hypothetical protein CTY31_11385 [Hyphomicrobium sp.]|nr:MAG: hypothetical protein CTY39_00870 [Hyphomicrobium sp.]PPC99010.1 MAG: hypothetical protein CTY31_11385 [Hyphomicrobium sp.]
MKAPMNNADRRAFGRRPTYQHAVVLMTGRAPVRCIVRDISLTGAMLEFSDSVALSSRIQVRWEGSGLKADCEVRHQHGTKAGIQFTCATGPRIAKEILEATTVVPKTSELPSTPAEAISSIVENQAQVHIAVQTRSTETTGMVHQMRAHLQSQVVEVPVATQVKKFKSLRDTPTFSRISDRIEPPPLPQSDTNKTLRG